MGNPVVHFDITVANDAKAHEFYTTLFGWKLNNMPEMGYALVDTDAGGKGIAGGIGRSQDGSASTAFYVEVDDVQAALDKAVSLGATVTQEVMALPGMVTLAMFADPEGNQIGLVGAQIPPAE